MRAREGGSGEGLEEKATRVPLAKRLQEEDSHWAGHIEVRPGWGCSPAEDWAPFICLVFMVLGIGSRVACMLDKHSSLNLEFLFGPACMQSSSVAQTHS